MLSSRALSQSATTTTSTTSSISNDLDDDLLSLLGSDTFSLESHRDRDLVLLSGILNAALTHPSSTATTSSSPRWITPAAPTRTSSTSSSQPPWNGWRPSEPPSAPFNSYTSSSSYNQLPLPPPTPKGTPLSSTIPLPSCSPTSDTFRNTRSSSISRNSGAGNSAINFLGGSCSYRVPTASRERGYSTETQGGSRPELNPYEGTAQERGVYQGFWPQSQDRGETDEEVYVEEDARMDEDF